MSQPPVVTTGGLPEPTQEERTFALLVHLSAFFGAILVPLIVYVVKKDQSPFVAYHALQALVFQLGVFVVAMVATTGTAVITLGMCPFGCVLYLAVFACIPFAIKANNGEWAGYPFLESVGRPPGL